MSIDDKLQNAHCYHNGQLQYRSEIDKKTASKDAKKFAAYCCLDADYCVYGQQYRGHIYCNARQSFNKR